MNRAGQRFGPRALRDESTYVLEEMDYTLFDRTRFVDYGDVFFHNGNMFDFLDQAERTVATILASGASPWSSGGDHLIPLPIVRAFAKRLGRPLSLVHFDGRLRQLGRDRRTRGAAAGLAALVDDGCIDPERSVQLVIRMVECRSTRSASPSRYACLRRGVHRRRTAGRTPRASGRSSATSRCT